MCSLKLNFRLRQRTPPHSHCAQSGAMSPPSHTRTHTPARRRRGAATGRASSCGACSAASPCRRWPGTVRVHCCSGRGGQRWGAGLDRACRGGGQGMSHCSGQVQRQRLGWRACPAGALHCTCLLPQGVGPQVHHVWMRKRAPAVSHLWARSAPEARTPCRVTSLGQVRP